MNVATVHASLPGTEGTREFRALESCGLSQTRSDVTRERTSTIRNGTCTQTYILTMLCSCHVYTDLHTDDALQLLPDRDQSDG